MTLLEFMDLNRSIGNHWFDAGTVRYWGTRVSNWDALTGYFITSEYTFDKSARRYTLRRGDLTTGRVETIGQFQAYATIKAAKAALASTRDGVQTSDKERGPAT